jgi:YVTN family beta-propeller protein
MGLMESNITTTGANSTGFVITEGLIGNLNTAGTTAGDPVWLGVNGALIYGLINKPYAPNHLVFIGIVTKVSAGNGEIFVKVQNGFELKELHDVQAQSPTLKDTLWYDNTVSPAQWKTASISTILGYNPLTPYQKQSFQNRAQNNSLGMLYCPANNVVYCSNSSTGFVYCYNVTTGALLASINVTSATAVMYLPVKGEIYVTTFNTGTITRISTAATPTLIGTITGSGTWGIDLVEYSATKVFIVNSASNTTTVINPTTNTVVASIATVNLVSSITLNSNVASLHNGMLILSGSGGIGMINPATNTLVAAANNLGSLLNTGAKIIYNSTQDLYLYCDFGSNQLTYISPLAATTFSISFYTPNLNKISNIVFDSTNNIYIAATINLTTTANTYPTPITLNFIDSNTRLSLRQVPTTSNVLSAVYQSAYLSAGSTVGKIYVSGSGSLLTNEIIYA